MICVKCKLDRARRTERAGIPDQFANAFFFKPYVCQACKHRFHAFRRDAAAAELSARLSRPRNKRNRERGQRELVIYGIAALVIIYVIYSISQQRVGAG